METTSQPKNFAAAFWAIVMIAPLPGLMVYLAWLSELEQYGYVFPLLLALPALVFFRWDHRIRFPSDPAAMVLTGLAASLTLFAAIRVSPWMSAVAFVVLAIAWLRTHRSSESAQHRLTYLSLVLLMLVRLPLNLDLRLVTSLQRMTSRVSSSLLDSFGVTHYLRGNVIELPGGTLFIEEACSGVQSLFTVLFLVCLWIVYKRRPLIATPAYLLAGVVWAMAMNVIRITSVALAQEWYDIDLSGGTPHEILGWICLAGAVLMMLSTDRLLRVLFYPIPPDPSGQIGNPLSRLWNQALLWGTPEDDADVSEHEISRQLSGWRIPPAVVSGAVVVAALFCVPSLVLGYRMVATRFETELAGQDTRLLWAPTATLMNNTSYASKVTDHQSLRDANSKQLGNHADVWTVVIDGLLVRIAVSQPYPEWHDMRLCYSGNGWQANDWMPVLDPAPPQQQESDGVVIPVRGAEDWKVSYAEMVRDTGEFGTILFCGMAKNGELLSPPVGGLYSLIDNRSKDRSLLQSETIMLQLWAESPKPLAPEQLVKLQQLFDSFRFAVLDEFLRSTHGMTSAVATELTTLRNEGARQ